MGDGQLDPSERDVLAALNRQTEPISAIQLINILRDTRSEDDVRRAMWNLIGRHQVRLTRDRLLQAERTQQIA